MLGSLPGLVVLDEIQQLPELFSTLQVLVDRLDNQARFIILSSASPQLIRNASESLAGRVEFIELNEFNLSETGSAARYNFAIHLDGKRMLFLLTKQVNGLQYA